MFPLALLSLMAQADLPAPTPPAPYANPAAAEGRREGARRESVEEEIEAIEERAAWDLFKRSPDQRSPLPYERYLAAKEHVKRMAGYSSARRYAAGQKPSMRNAMVGNWEELGPGNIGGRTRSWLIDPGNPLVMYAGAVSGGVWKSTDGGRSWKPLTDFLANLGVTTLAFDPKNTQVIYAGTGESFASNFRGFGIFRSRDGGATWEHLESTKNSDFFFVNKLVVSPNDSSRIYVATVTGLFRSLDAGATWTRVIPTGCQEIAVRTDQANDSMFVSCPATGGLPAGATIYRNTNAASDEPWEAVFTADNMGRTSLAIAPSNQAVVYAMSAYRINGELNNSFLAIYRSMSNGDKDSWERRAHREDGNRINATLLSNPLLNWADICNGGTRAWSNQGSYDNVLAVDPVNPEIVWAGGIDLFRSNDGGMSFGFASDWAVNPAFRTYVHADQHVILFHPQYDGVNNKILYTAGDGGVFITTDALAPVATGDRAYCSTTGYGVNWANLNNGYATIQFLSGSVYPGGHAYIGGAQDNGTMRGRDAAGPLGWTTVSGGDGGYSAIDPTNPNTIYTTIQYMDPTRRFEDGGFAARVILTGVTDRGSTTRFNFYAPFVIDPNEPKRLYLGGRILWRTENRGDSWVAAAREFESNSSAIAVAPGNSSRVVVGSSQGFIYRSEDAVSTTNTSVWPNVRPRAGVVADLTFDPQNQDVIYAVYATFNAGAANSGHVFRSTNGGADWQLIDGTGPNSIPDIPVHSVIVHPANSSILYVGTDLGVFVSTDGGANWLREELGIPNTRIEMLKLADNNGPVLYAFSFGRGVFRVRLTDAPPCSFKAATINQDEAHPIGGALPLQIDTGEACRWSAIPTAAWALAPNPATGVGPAQPLATLALNLSTARRQGTLAIGDQFVTVRQRGASFFAPSGDPAAAPEVPALPFVGITDTRAIGARDANPVHSCTQAVDSKSTWLRFRAPATGRINLAAAGQRFDNGFNYGVVLAAYERAADGGPGQELGCRTILGNAFNFANVSLDAEAGKTYLIRVSGAGGANPGGQAYVTVTAPQ